MHQRFKRPVFIVIENHASGVQLIADLAGKGLSIKEFTPSGSKEDRFQSITPMLESGKVLFPKTPPIWWLDFKKEMLGFPNTKYKDQVDSLSQACIYMKSEKIIDWRAILD